MSAEMLKERISIHAPHEGERPCGADPLGSAWAAISIHAPHEGERRLHQEDEDAAKLFQSTLPTRGSDSIRLRVYRIVNSISIHAPHEGERLRQKSRR